MITPVILCGGSGSRLWPLSRAGLPKQFHALFGEHSLLQQTVQRISQQQGFASPLLLGAEEQRFLLAQQLQDIGVQDASIMLEPCPRNTAPAIACAALHCLQHDPQALLLVMPSDHVLTRSQVFLQAVQQAAEVARQGHLMTFGIVPDRAETGYGYVQQGTSIPDSAAFHVQRFVEKPDAATAQAYLDAGGYYWNSGIFLLPARLYLDELDQHATSIRAACQQAYDRMQTDRDFLSLDAAAFARCPDNSIDYAVMEPTQYAAMLPLDAGWSDIGAWDALYALHDKDADNNVAVGDVLTLDTHNSYLRADARLLAVVGVADLAVIETSDAVLVCQRSAAQQVKQVVEQLKREQRSEPEWHRMVCRPWGSYEGINQGPRYQVKQIDVKPGASLSLQRHQHRAEHWVVVEGVAEVTRDKELIRLNVDESTYIPVGMLHRLHNPGPGTLKIIEIQSGDYLGEDDIERFDDLYGRES